MENMLRHVLRRIPGFKPLEASHIKSSASSASRGAAPFSDALSIQSASLSSNAAGKKSVRDMDADQTARPFIVHSSEIVTYESLAPYLRELEVRSKI